MSDPYAYLATQLPTTEQAAISAFWQHFAGRMDAFEKSFASGITDDCLEDMQAALVPVSSDLMWEFGPSDRGHSLTITAENEDTLRPLARALMDQAPDLPGWRFFDARRASSDGEVLDLVAARRSGPLLTETAKIRVGDVNAVDLVTTGDGDNEARFNEALMLFSVMMGEALDRVWLGLIDTKPARRRFFRAKAPPLDIPALRVACEKSIAVARANRPDRPFRDTDPDTREVALLEMNGVGPWPREDLITLATAHAGLEQAQLTGRRFCSERYSRHGETFMIAQVPRRDAQFDDVAARYALEDKLHAALVDAQAGGVVGGAFGEGSVYVTVGLLEIAAGLDAMADVLNAFSDTLIHFLDPGLAERSIEI